MKRFQFVWWWRDLKQWGFRVHNWDREGLGMIYRYSIIVGPLEIRRWHSH